MKREYSISPELAQACGLKLAPMPSSRGGLSGAEKIHTHSSLLSWQFDLSQRKVGLFREHIVIAVEAYSHFALILPYQQTLPSWQQLQSDFHQLWWDQLVLHLGRTQFVNEQSDIELIQQRFVEQKQANCWLNHDEQLSEQIELIKRWINSFCDKFRVDRLSANHVWNLLGHINIESRSANSDEQTPIPLARFLDDSLYRFAQGLGEGDKAFANPHRKEVALTVV
ncbi:hypothetical protein [Agaribacterium sp. ZY112]|uniref:hypothetical protein n=1 Tax=Agaribacterium sp. ZY112 TaxID=3233574 RepID=UPI003524617E